MINGEHGSFASDNEILSAAQKLQAFVSRLARNTMKVAGALKLAWDKRCLDDLGWTMSLRGKSLSAYRVSERRRQIDGQRYLSVHPTYYLQKKLLPIGALYLFPRCRNPHDFYL
jgi:hypothetical protein